MGKIPLNERILDESQILENDPTKLPQGIIARIRRTICEIGKKNANNRVYEKVVWKKVLSDPEFKRKLENRQILGEMEHPIESQIKLDKDRTSHIVSNLFIDESNNVVKADFDLLPTEAGKFIWVLHEAGVKVPASTRAEGELSEDVDEAGEKYQRVIPESYTFITVDHTGDPSVSITEPENIIKAVKTNYENHKLNKNVAIALLETIKTEEAKKLEEKIEMDLQHPYCKCGLNGKKCNAICEDRNIMEEIKPGSMVKIEDKKGIISYIFPRIQKCIIQLVDGKITKNIKECQLIKEATYPDVYLGENPAKVIKGEIITLGDNKVKIIGFGTYEERNYWGEVVEGPEKGETITFVYTPEGKFKEITKEETLSLENRVRKLAEKNKLDKKVVEEYIELLKEFPPTREYSDKELLEEITRVFQLLQTNESIIKEQHLARCSQCGEFYDVRETESGLCSKCEEIRRKELETTPPEEETEEEKFEKKVLVRGIIDKGRAENYAKTKYPGKVVEDNLNPGKWMIIKETKDEDVKIEHPDPSGLIHAAHEYENILLVWWYNPLTAEFIKSKDPKALHVYDIGIRVKNYKDWFRGRVFKYQGKVYLIVYYPEKKKLTSLQLTDIFDKAYNSVDEPITRVIDDNGKDISNLMESINQYPVEKSKLGFWKINEKGEVKEDYMDDSTKIAHGFVCLSCGEPVTIEEMGKGISRCCGEPVVTKEEWEKQQEKLMDNKINEEIIKNVENLEQVEKIIKDKGISYDAKIGTAYYLASPSRHNILVASYDPETKDLFLWPKKIKEGKFVVADKRSHQIYSEHDDIGDAETELAKYFKTTGKYDRMVVKKSELQEGKFKDIEIEIQDKIIQGQTDEEIIKTITEKYPEYISIQTLTPEVIQKIRDKITESKIKESIAKIYKNEEEVGKINLYPDGVYVAHLFDGEDLEQKDLDTLETNLENKGLKVVYESKGVLNEMKKLKETQVKLAEIVAERDKLTEILTKTRENYKKDILEKWRPKESYPGEIGDLNKTLRRKLISKGRSEEEVNKMSDNEVFKELAKTEGYGHLFKESKEKSDEKGKEVSFYDIYKENLEFEKGDKRKAVEGALSLWTGGIFDAFEGEKREEMINTALAKMEELDKKVIKESHLSTIISRVKNRLQDVYKGNEKEAAKDSLWLQSIRNLQEYMETWPDQFTKEEQKEADELYVKYAQWLRVEESKEKINEEIVLVLRKKNLIVDSEEKGKELKEKLQELNIPSTLMNYENGKWEVILETIKPKEKIIPVIEKKILEEVEKSKEIKKLFEIHANFVKQELRRKGWKDKDIEKLSDEELHKKGIEIMKEIEQKENENKDLKEQIEKLQKEIIKIYYETLLETTGLQLPNTILTLLEKAVTKEEVDQIIESAKTILKNNFPHFEKLNEIKIDSQIPMDPEIAKIYESVTKAFKAMNNPKKQ